MAPDYTAEPSKWVCRLLAHFERGDSVSGSGFLVNMPFTNKHCIVTAGHVLQRPVEGLAVRMDVFFPDGGLTNRPTFTADRSELFVAAGYAEAPTLSEGDASAVCDYGLVALDKARHPVPPGVSLDGGCALSILPSRSELLHTGGTVYGYGHGALMQTKKTSPFARPVQPHVLEYEKEVEGREGVSGGPLFVSYRGSDVAIGIHNYNGRATRITIPVMLDVLRWLGDYGLYRTFADSSRPTVYLQSTSGRAPNVVARPGRGPNALWMLVPTYIAKGTSNLVNSYVMIGNRSTGNNTSFFLLTIEADEADPGTSKAGRAPAPTYSVKLRDSSAPYKDNTIYVWSKNDLVKVGLSSKVCLAMRHKKDRLSCPCGCITQHDDVGIESLRATRFEMRVAPN